MTALLGGLVFAVAATAYELATSQLPSRQVGVVPVTEAGTAAAGVCVLIGVAIGALCSPPLVRHPAQGMLALGIATIFAVAASVSPANAAIHGTMSPAHTAPGLPAAPAVIAVVIAAAVLGLSTIVAAYRTGV